MKEKFQYLARVLPFIIGILLFCGCATNRAGAAKPKASSGAVAATSDEELERRVQANAHYGAGLSYDLNDKPDKALDEYFQSAMVDPRYEPLILEASRRLLRAQKTDKAIELLKRATSIPTNPGSFYAWLALAYAQAGKFDLAVTANQTAMKKMPGHLAGYQNLSQIYLQQKRTNDALAVIEKASRQNATDPEFWVGLAEIFGRFGHQHIITAEDAKKRALEALDRAAKIPTNNILILQKIGDGYLLNGESAKAEPIYLRLVKEFPDLPGLREKLANIYLRSDKKEQAAEQLEEIRKENPTDPQTYFFLGGIASEQKQYDKAAEYYETALKLNPDLEPIYYELAGVYVSGRENDPALAAKKADAALAVLERARARFKLNFVLEFYTGVAYSIKKDYKEAIAHLTSAELIAKTSEPARLTHLFYYQMGSTYERLGDQEAAEKSFRKCLELSPNYPDALNYLGYMWAERGVKLDEAREMIKKAVDLEPKNSAFLDSLGWVLYKLKKPEEALPYMRQAIESSEEADPTLYDHLGDIYASLRQFDQARDAWSRSLKVESNDQIKKKIENIPKLPTYPKPGPF